MHSLDVSVIFACFDRISLFDTNFAKTLFQCDKANFLYSEYVPGTRQPGLSGTGIVLQEEPSRACVVR